MSPGAGQIRQFRWKISRKKTKFLDDRCPHTISGPRFSDNRESFVILAVSEPIAILLKDFSELAKVGGSIEGKASGYPEPNRHRAGQHGVCSALGCDLHPPEPQPTGSSATPFHLTLDCPWHGSIYESAARNQRRCMVELGAVLVQRDVGDQAHREDDGPIADQR